MEGFGAALTGSSAYVMLHNSQYELIMQDLFGDNGIGYTFL